MKTKIDFMLFLGNIIKKAREQAGLTQEELAGLIGISRTAIARYELGEIEPKIRNLIAIAETLNVSIDYLLGTKHGKKANDLDLTDEAMEALQQFIRELKKK